MTQVDRVLAMREGGAVQRCHTTPHFGSYSVAEHTYGVLSLLVCLHPPPGPSTALLFAALVHDVPERWTGDIPSPAKWSDELLKYAASEMEGKILEDLSLHQDLSLYDTRWLRACDYIEFYLWLREQHAMGSQVAFEMLKRVVESFKDFDFPEECWSFLKEYQWKRLNDGVRKGEIG